MSPVEIWFAVKKIKLEFEWNIYDYMLHLLVVRHLS